MRDLQEPPAVFPTQKRAFGMILRDTLQVYKSYGITFTRPLLKPVAQIIVSGYGSLITGYLTLDYLLTYHQALVMTYPWITAIAMMPPSLILLYFFCQGFWSYLIYFVSLNLNVAEALENKPLNFKDAYQTIQQKSWPYSSLLLTYGGISLFPFVLLLAFMIPAMVLMINPSTIGLAFILVIIGYAVAGIGLLVVLLLSIFLTPIFQITAFETIPLNPLPTLLKSMRIIGGNFWRALGLQIILILITAYLLPYIAIQLMQVLHVTDLLNSFHTWLVHLLLKGAAPYPGIEPIPFYSKLYFLFKNYTPEVSKYLTETLISITVNGLLLPLGTIAFTLLYLDIRQHSNQNKKSEHCT